MLDFLGMFLLRDVGVILQYYYHVILNNNYYERIMNVLKPISKQTTDPEGKVRGNLKKENQIEENKN